MNTSNKLVEESEHTPSIIIKFAQRLIPILIFFFIFPTILFLIPAKILDQWFEFPRLSGISIRILFGGALLAFGSFFLISSLRAQQRIGKGSPMQLKPTLLLVVEKPYSFSRNPMYLGLITFFFGISSIIGSLSSLGMVFVFSLLILLYAKAIEEKQLVEKFGDNFLEYKKATPFLFPTNFFIGDDQDENETI